MTFRPLFALVLATLTLPPALSGQSPPPSDDASVGVWPWLVGNIDADAPNIIAQSQAAGLDTIYLHLFRSTGTGVGTLHMADEAGNWNPAHGPIDPDVTLSTFLAQAHAANLQVIGVVNCFLGPPSPGDPVHEAMLLAVVDYLVNNFTSAGAPRYALDGIALDRCRFYSGTGNPHALVTAFVQQVKARLGLVPLHAFLMANLDSFDGPQPYNAQFRTYSQVMSLLQSQWGQHWQNLAPYLDANLPMAYIASGSYYGTNTAQMQAYVQTAAAYARQAAVNAGFPAQRVLPAIRAWTDTTGTTTAATLDASMAGALAGAGDGFMPFRYYTMSGQPSWWSAVTARCVPGCGWPLATLASVPIAGLTIRLDAASSTTLAYPTGSLQYRFDLDDDGVADTPWSAVPTSDLLAPASGAWRVAVQVRDPAGRTAVRKRRVSASLPSFAIGGGALPASTGGTRSLAIDVGPGGAGDLYVIAATASGTSPGFPLAPGITVPLNFDAVTQLSLQLANSPVLPGAAGVLDAAGHGAGALVLGPGMLPPSLAWHTIHFAAAGADPLGSGWTFATNAAGLLVLP